MRPKGEPPSQPFNPPLPPPPSSWLPNTVPSETMDVLSNRETLTANLILDGIHTTHYGGQFPTGIYLAPCFLSYTADKNALDFSLKPVICGNHNAFGHNWAIDITLIKPWTSIQLPGNHVWEISLGYNGIILFIPNFFAIQLLQLSFFFQSCLVKSDTFSPYLISYLPPKWQKKNSHAHSTNI